MKSKLISYITVVKNNPIGLKRTIESIISQKNDEIEYIVIDGKSSDNTTEVIELYSSSIDYYNSEEDSGIYDAMNKGILASCGSYICFMNAGDILEKNAVRNILKFTKNDYEIIYGDHFIEYENTKREYVKAVIENITYKMSVSHQSLYIHRDIYINYGLYDTNYKYASDYKYLLNLYLLSRKFKYIHYPLSIFSTGGASDKNILKSRIESIKIVFKSKGSRRYMALFNYIKEILSYVIIRPIKLLII